MTSRKWIISFLTVLLICLLGIATLNILIDPFFHYHKPSNGLEYPMRDDRYINDGIQRHFDYEVMITGTSEGLNFNSSKVEELWNKTTIKTCYAGASLHELSQSIQRAIKYNPKLDTVICTFDFDRINASANLDNYTGIPDFLYDDNIFNDVKYIFNKDVVTKSIAVINYTRSGQKTPSFDEYGRFDYLPTGRDVVFANIDTSDTTRYNIVFGEEDREQIGENIVNNLVKLAKANPEVRFVFFVPPYSYCYWEHLERSGQIDFSMDACEYATGLMLQAENIELYCFSDREDVVCNLDYYTDVFHYNGEVCDRICEWIYEGEGLLTEENYKEYFAKLRRFYKELDYSDVRQMR